MGDNWNPLNKAIADQYSRRSGESEKKHHKEAEGKFKKEIVRKIRTSFIAALDYFEKTFGYLWGHNKPKSKLTKEEKEYREIWEEVRKQILDKGNAQIRGIEREFHDYIIQSVFSKSESKERWLKSRLDYHRNSSSNYRNQKEGDVNGNC